MTDTTPKGLAVQLLAILDRDESRLERLDNYSRGYHDDPYMPELADNEYKLLAERAVSNWMPLLVDTPAQALYVDGFRRGMAAPSPEAGKPLAADESPEWDHWQYSRLDARQSAIYKGAFRFGHSFALTLKPKGKAKAITTGLSALRTAAVYEDPANDHVPYAALTVTSWPSGEGDEAQPGKARLWDAKAEYPVTFYSLTDAKKVKVGAGVRHGATECPVTRFAASVDLEGRTVGVIEPAIPLQNRINQTIFDLLVAQTYGSFKVRWATGMAPPLEMTPVLDEITGEPTGEMEPVLDAQGNPKPLQINVNAKRFLWAEDEGVNFGSLDETPLGGFIDSIDMSIRHLSALAQIPPHHLLGQIANLSAEALAAAETSLARKVEEFRKSFGESWERVFRLAAELNGDTEAVEDYQGEVLWRDMESRSLAASADALAKLKELGIPVRGLMRRVPGVTQNEISSWEQMLDDEPEVALAQAVTRATPASSYVGAA